MRISIDRFSGSEDCPEGRIYKIKGKRICHLSFVNGHLPSKMAIDK
jgi:hypothetical protein